MAGRPKNVVVLMADEHAWWASGAYGHPFIATPTLDRLAARGVTFDAAYCNAPLCAPSRASFLTGRLPHSIGAWNNGLPLASDLPTWAHHLSVAGYQTVLAGKQHFVGEDQRHGFELRLGGEIHSTRTRPYSYVTAAVGPLIRQYVRAAPGRNRFIDHDYEMTDRALGFLRGDGRDRRRPFALCLSLFAPHFPFEVEQAYWDRYWPAHGDLPDVPAGTVERLHPAWRAQRDYYRVADLEDADVRRARAAYYGLCTFVDEQLGRVVDALETSGLAEDTLIVYTTDHGEHLGDHGLWLKKTFFESSARVPLIMSWPGTIPEGVRRDRVVSLVDVAATLVEWTGGSSAGMDGRSLTPIIENPEAPWADVAISEHVGTDELMMLPHEPIAGAPRRMLRAGRYKLSWFLGERPELYDLESDPRELHDLAGDPALASIVADLTRRVLADWDPEQVLRTVRDTLARTKIIMDAETTYLGAVPKAMT